MSNCERVFLSKYDFLPRNPGQGHVISGVLARAAASTNELGEQSMQKEKLLSPALGGAERGRGLHF